MLPPNKATSSLLRARPVYERNAAVLVAVSSFAKSCKLATAIFSTHGTVLERAMLHLDDISLLTCLRSSTAAWAGLTYRYL